MTKINFFIAFCMGVILFSCEKNPDELTITVNNTGTITFNVLDGTTPIEGAKVVVSYDDDILKEGETDGSGIFTTDRLLEGTYSYSVEVTKNNITYSDYKRIQVISGINQLVKSQPYYANLGAFTLTVLNSKDQLSPVKDINIALTTHYSLDKDVLAQAGFKMKTDANGVAKFENVPNSRYYFYVMYSFDVNGDVKIYGYNQFFLPDRPYNTSRVTYIYLID